MANDDEISARGGMLPVNFPYGNFRRNLYRLSTSTTADVFIGQPMGISAGSSAVCIPAAASAAGTSKILGSVVGFVDINKAGLPENLTSLTQNGFLDRNTDAFCIISDDPEQLYMIQEDTGGGVLYEGNIGQTGVFVTRTSSGNTLTGYSTAEFDRSTIVATGSGSLQLVGLVDKMNSDGTPNTFGNYGKLLVRIAHPALGVLGDINPGVP